MPFCGDEALPAEETDPVLLALYNDTGGDDWTNNTRWLTNQPIDKWFGGLSGGPGLVTGLQLPENNLTGEMPPQLGGLDALGVLDLSGNNLTGEIPAQLGDRFFAASFGPVEQSADR